MLAPCPKPEHQKLADLPGSGEGSKIEVWSRTDAAGETLLELVEYSWGSGLGWYVQKRMTLEAGQVEALRALLGTPAPLASPGLRRTAPAVSHDGNVIRLSFAG